MFSNLTRKLQSLGGPDKKNPELISYRQLRRVIGLLGLFLALMLAVGGMLLGTTKGIQPSISHYYYTNMREVFVGTLCAVSVFLFCYKGHNRQDSIVANIAATFGLLVALFPTNLSWQDGKLYGGQARLVSLATFRGDALKDAAADSVARYHPEALPQFLKDQPATIHETIHFTSAALFFGSLAYMSIVLFTKSDKDEQARGRMKRIRNRIYRVCGWVMLLTLAGLFIYFKLPDSNPLAPIVFIGEVICLIAFGTSWLVKGAPLTQRSQKSTQSGPRPPANILQLRPSESRELQVSAQSIFSTQCLSVQPGERYEISWTADQRWRDWLVRTHPGGYWWNLPALIRGMRVDTLCFSLCAAYNDDDERAFPVAEGRERHRTLDIPDTPDAGTLLSFFANDVPGYYRNNRGEIRITVKRLK